MITYEGYVKRCELNLRAEYVDLKTTIFKVSDVSFEIYCENSPIEYNLLEHEFNRSFLILGTPAKLTKIKPEEYLEIIPSISDTELSLNFEGVALSRIDLSNLIISKFPAIELIKIDDVPKDRKINVFIKSTNSSNKKELCDFLEKLNIPTEFVVFESEEELELQREIAHNPINYIYSSRYKGPRFEFEERDEALWFDNIDKIYNQEYSKEHLYFIEPSKYTCYIDYSVFDNINLRNVLLLYEVVFISLPIEDKFEKFLSKNQISSNEFLELVNRGRIKIIVNQPIFRYYTDIIKESYKVNPNSVITRRALAALQTIDIVDTAQNYIFNDPLLINEIGAFASIISKEFNLDFKYIYSFLSWPIKAQRHSFNSMTFGGANNISGFGANRVIDKHIGKQFNKDLEFEFAVSSPSIHLAHSLNATYFPFRAEDGFSDIYYSNVMGNMLNFYKSARVDLIESFTTSLNEKEDGISPIDFISVFEFDDYCSILETESVFSSLESPTKGHGLIKYLSEFDKDERKAKIEEYNDKIEDYFLKINKKKFLLDLGVNAGLDAAGLIVPGLGTAKLLGEKGFNYLKSSNQEVKKIIKKVEKVFESKDVDKRNLDYLIKINRVARIKKNYK